jgi:hypothetical protein
MPDEIKYKILEVPLLGRNLAASRTPRLQPSVPEEYGDMLSSEVTRGDWSVDPENGQPLNSKGQPLQDHLEMTLKTRPHWLMPVDKGSEDEAEKVWLSGNITLQGQRLVQLENFCGSKAAALVMWKEEATRFGATAGSPVPGIKPGEDGDKKKAAEREAKNNPWSADFRGDDDARAERIASIIKTGTRFADQLAKAAGTVVSKPLRRK